MKPASQTEAEAAAWLAKRDAGNWHQSDQAALDDWTSACTANRVAFLRLHAVWDKADRLRAIAGSIAIAPDPETKPYSEFGRAHRRRWYAPLTAVAAAVAAVATPLLLIDEQAEVYSTPVGGFQRLPLADGSRIEINTDSRLELRFSKAERRVKLDQGEAFFDVASDRTRPFVVSTGGYRVIAVGTAFSVRKSGGTVAVIVTEGRVRLERVGGPEGPGNSALISAGHAVDVSEAVVVVRRAPTDTFVESLGWREGVLVFNAQPLAEVAAEFNRYNRRQLLVDPSAADVVIGGSFRATNLQGFLRLLERGFGVRPEPVGDRLLLRRG